MRRWPFILFGLIFLCSLMAEWITNDRPIVIFANSRMYCPAYKVYSKRDFGESSDQPVWNYRQVKGFKINPILPYGAHTLDYDLASPAKPSFRHLLGTDDHGRDVLARLLYGVRISLIFGFLLAALGIGIAIIIGSIQGYFGGMVDLLMGRSIEIWASIPSLFLTLIIATPNFFSLLFIMLLFNWLSLANTIRIEFFRGRTLDYVIAARALGLPAYKIIWRHILPNAIVGVRSYFPFMVSYGLVQLASLNFLGFGLPFGMPSLGDLLSQAKDNVDAPWIAFSVFSAMLFILGLLIIISEEFKHADAR